MSQDLSPKVSGRAGSYFRPFWILSLGAVMVVLTISAVFIFLATQTIERGVSSLHLGIAQHAKSIITGSFERFFAEQERIAADLGRRQDQWSETLALALKNNPAFEQIAFTDARGK